MQSPIQDPRNYEVAWETGMQSNPENPLDDCAIQGPHTRDKAYQIAKDIQSAGLKASVIDCTRSNQIKYDMLQTLEHVEKVFGAKEVDPLQAFIVIEQVRHQIAKARGSL